MRSLIAIGCNSHVDTGLATLLGAENDATEIFDLLVTNALGGYGTAQSRLLLSPTLDHVRLAIEQTLFDAGPITEFTFFFAGHGAVKDGAYFLCFSDTLTDRLSVTGLGVAQLFAWINEASVGHSNLVIDSCESGGLSRDIGAFLKPDRVGRVGSPSVAILASSAADQLARETNGHGIGTATLLRCLTGHLVVQRVRPHVDLLEIGPVVADAMRAAGHQAPVYWGLNLFGRSTFAQNRCYTATSAAIPGFDDESHYRLTSHAGIRERADRIWRLYLSVDDNFDADEFVDLTQEVLADVVSGPGRGEFVLGITNAFGERLSRSVDPFEEPQLCASSIAALLPYYGDTDVALSILAIAKRLIESVDRAIAATHSDLVDQPFSLLSRNSTFGDLFFLPLRILRILGWAGARAHIAQALGIEPSSDAITTSLLQRILETYAGSFSAISDEQTTYLVTFATAAHALQLTDELEQVVGLLFHSYHKYKGKIAGSGLSGVDALKFVEGRANADPAISESLIAKPAEMLAALVLSYHVLDLDGLVDDCIADFDRLPMNLFVPTDYSKFLDRRIRDGTNHTFEIGHTVWCVADFVKEWNNIREEIARDECLKAPAGRVGAICASLVRPDRVSWFLFDRG